VKPALLIYRDAKRVGPYCGALKAAEVPAEAVPVDQTVSMRDFGGLVLAGGTDLDPALYGEQLHPEADEPDRERDAREMALLGEAMALHLPVLAICRGAQILNVFHGGSLIQHLMPPERHRQTEGDRSQPVHSVRIEPGTLLHEIAGTERWQVNSRHHQAVNVVGRNLRVSAVDPEDGTIEALERADRRFVLGVQWHPEDQVFRDSGQLNLFRSFGRAANP